jgi:hypothetical protein
MRFQSLTIYAPMDTNPWLAIYQSDLITRQLKMICTLHDFLCFGQDHTFYSFCHLPLTTIIPMMMDCSSVSRFKQHTHFLIICKLSTSNQHMKKGCKLYLFLLPISNYRFMHLGLDAICGNHSKKKIWLLIYFLKLLLTDLVSWLSCFLLTSPLS